MSSPTHLVSILTILFLFIDVFSHSTVSADKKLVDKVCGDDAITDHAKCLKTLSNAKAMAAKNINELVEVVMEKGAAKTKKTLNFVEEKMKKPNSPAARTALKSCAEVYRYCINAFKLVGPELKVDPMSANYDIALILPEVGKCVKALQAAKLLIPELVKGNHELYYYASLGFEMTGHLH